MESELEDFRKQIRDLCLQVEKRIKELGEMDIMTYRNDPQMRALRTKICTLYRKGANMCKTYGEAIKVCELFKEDPVCLNQLMLSEELVCPVTTEEKEK